MSRRRSQIALSRRGVSGPVEGDCHAPKRLQDWRTCRGRTRPRDQRCTTTPCRSRRPHPEVQAGCAPVSSASREADAAERVLV